jgi:hypothetical protein
MTRLAATFTSFSCSLVALAIAVVCLPAQTASAQTSQPAADSPKGVLLAYTKALNDGDGATIHKMLLTTSPTEERIANAMADYAATLAGLSKAATDKFGADAAHDAFGDPAMAVKQAADNVKASTETVTGDTATVSVNQSRQGTMKLQKVDGQWKIVVADMVRSVDAGNLEKMLKDIDSGNAIVKQMATDIAAGKYPTAVAAKSALNEKIGEVKAEEKAEDKSAATTKPM